MQCFIMVAHLSLMFIRNPKEFKCISSLLVYGAILGNRNSKMQTALIQI